MSPAGITRQLWRLRAFGLIKKVAHTYRYYLTRLGRAAIAAACRLTGQIIIPSMATTP
jgi:DNA-binding HxlR family transcriptional regulator